MPHFRPSRTDQHKALREFLLDAFSANELRRFVRLNFGDAGREIANSVSFEGPPNDVVDALVDVLLQRRVMSDLWPALRNERPNRKGEIGGIERMFVWRHVPAQEKIKILIVTADVEHMSLDLEGEIDTIRAEVAQAPHGNHFEFTVRKTALWDDLVSAILTERPTIVQFSGHCTEGGNFLFRSREGGSHTSIPAAVFAGLLTEQHGDVVLVLLNACYSATVAKRLGTTCDHVIGMNEEIEDTAAIRFASVFYRSLAQGTSIPEAFGVAANELILVGQRSVPALWPPRP